VSYFSAGSSIWSSEICPLGTGISYFWDKITEISAYFN